MDGSRFSAGKFRLERQAVMMADVLEAAVQMCKPAMDKRQQRLIEKMPEEPIQVNADAMRLTQAFSNLLDNASKYTPEGGEVRLTMAPFGQRVMVTVADNGIGISAQALPHIFDLFVQDATAAAFAQTSHGLGIGLAVVRELVEAHGGTVSASSKGAHLGSEFIVNLPTD